MQTLFAGDELGWSALLMGTGKHFQARTLERVDALAFEGAELLAACREDTQFGFILMQRLLGVVAERLQATTSAAPRHALAGGGTRGCVGHEDADVLVRFPFAAGVARPAIGHGVLDRFRPKPLGRRRLANRFLADARRLP